MASADSFHQARQQLSRSMLQFSSAFGFPIDTSFVTITYIPGGPDVTVGVTNYPLFAGMNFLGGLQNIQVTRAVVFRHEWSS
jgi:hypothetical protein